MSDPARLPKGAPRSLRQFVKCEVDEAALDLTDAAWLNEIPMISGATTSARAGSTPNSATVTFDAEWTPAFDLEVSVVDGRLTASVPGAVGQVANEPITEWTDALNKTLADNDKQIRDLRVDGTTLRLRKQPIPPPPVDDPVPATPPVVEVPAPEPEPSGGIGCLPKILAGVTAVLVAIGIVAATRGGGDETESTDSVVSEIPPASEAPLETDPPATEPTDPTTTVAEVGQATPVERVPTEGLEDAAAYVCYLIVGSDPEVDPAETETYGDLDLPSGSCKPAADPLAAYVSCDPQLLPCSVEQGQPLLVGGTPGTDHQRQVGDSASTLEELLAYLSKLLADEPTVGASATCGGREVSGTADLEADNTARVDLGLYSYGTCSDRELTTTVGGRTYRFPQVDDFVVDASEPDPVMRPPDAYAFANEELLDGQWMNDVLTINNVIGGRAEIDDDCFWFFEPQNVSAIDRVLDGCGTQNHFWVFAAATTDVEVQVTVTDSVTGTTATYANPLGRAAPPLSEIDDFDATGTLFDHSVFPCGFGFVAYTACSESEPPMEAGGFVTVSAAMGGPVPLVDDGVERAHDIDFGASGGSRYSIVQNGDEWVVTSSAGDTRARALIRNNSITLVVPNDELPDTAQSYQWTADIDGVVIEQPVIPVVGIITVPTVEKTAVADEAAPADEQTDEPTTTGSPDEEPVDSGAAGTAPTESLADFYTQLSASVSAGDLGFALDRLDPRVFDVYGDSCPAALESFADPDLSIEFISAGPIEDWVYEANEQTVEVPDSQAVTIRLNGRGQSGEESVAHLSIVDGTYRWFTFC